MSSVLQILYKNESGSLAKVVTVVANTVPPTFSLTHEAKEAKGGFDSVPFVFSAELAMILSSKLLVKCTKRCFENQFECRFFPFSQRILTDMQQIAGRTAAIKTFLNEFQDEGQCYSF